MFTMYCSLVLSFYSSHSYLDKVEQSMTVGYCFHSRHCATTKYNILKRRCCLLTPTTCFTISIPDENTDHENITIPEWVWVPLPKSRDNMVPRTPDVCVITEILDHSSLTDVQDRTLRSLVAATQDNKNVGADSIQNLAQSCKETKLLDNKGILF